MAPENNTPQMHLIASRARSIFGGRAVYILLLLGVLGLAIWKAADIAESRSLTYLQQSGSLRVNLYAASLRDTLEKYRHLPYMLARESRILALLQGEIPAIQVSPHLEDFSVTSGALIYVLDDEGTTVATSNWRSESSLLGHNFSFRPYFTDAAAGLSGAYYAVGLRTRQPGFFLSYPVRLKGNFLGAIVVKVDLEPMQDIWKASGETVIVSDAYGVIFLTSKKEWKYHSLRNLPADTFKKLQSRQYLQQPLPALPMTRQVRKGYTIIELGGSKYLELPLQLPEYGWRIHYLSSLAAVEGSVTLATTIGSVIAIVIFLALLYFRERRAKMISLQQLKDAAAIRQLNVRLIEEVTQHRKTAKNLHKTQQELVQAEKLAALGRMSAAIAHELNQPVTAIRTFAASCKVLLQRNSHASVEENLGYITKLTERMGTITGQLKTFARKSRGRQENIDMSTLAIRLLRLMEPHISKAGAEVRSQLPAQGEVIVSGDSLQVEQVLSNLIINGLDAMDACSEKLLELRISPVSGRAVIEVADSGAGIPNEAVDSLFDPFFTTKDVGAGLGLGLSISYGIVKEMNGTIEARNRPGGGAIFTITLPMVEELEDCD